jgi:hypothetical protein
VKINKANFLTWYNNTDYEPLPLLDKSCSFGNVCWAVSEDMSFIVNAMIGVPLSGVVALSLCNLDKSNVSSLGNTSYFTGETYGGIFHYKKITCPVVSEGYYILKIVSGSSTFYSSPIFVLNGLNLNNTIRFKFRHKFAKNNIEYTHSALSAFYQEFRLFGLITEVGNETTKDIVTDADSLKPREYNHKVDYTISGVLQGLDYDINQACFDMFSSSEIYMNDVLVQSKEFSPSPLKRNGKSNGTFTVSDYNLRYNKRV